MYLVDVQNGHLLIRRGRLWPEGPLKGAFFHLKPLYLEKMEGIDIAHLEEKNNPSKAHLYR